MKRWKKTLLAGLCAALLMGLWVPASGSAAGVYLMAVNDRVLVDVTAENMPTVAGGVLYVPYTMLSNRDRGINLGVTAMYSTTRRTVLVTDGRRGVEFDTRSNTSQDLMGNPLGVRAMVRNSMVFVPIDWLCQYFGSISCTRTRTRYGTLIRVTSAAATLGDREFVDAAENQLAASLQNYLASGGRGEDDPAPSEEVPPSDPPSGAELFLACRWGGETAECAQLLEGRSHRGLFLFTCEELEKQDGLVRRLVGAGHTVGLVLTGENAADCLYQAERGRSLLSAAARYNALVVSADSLDEPGREELVQAGYVVWSATVHGTEYSSGSALVRGLSVRRVNYVEVDCGKGATALLRGMLNAMEDENCQLYQATAPALG